MISTIEANKIGVVFSGGIDSTILLYEALHEERLKEVYTLSFDEGSALVETRENLPVILILRKLGRFHYHHFIRFPDTDQLTKPQLYQPIATQPKFKQLNTLICGYKMLMQVASMSYAQALGIDVLLFGYLQDNTSFSDEKPEHLQAVAQLYNTIYGSAITVLCPYQNMTKSELLHYAREKPYYPDIPLEYTLSCGEFHLAGLQHCGVCKSCKERKHAFRDFQDPTNYLK